MFDLTFHLLLFLATNFWTFLQRDPTNQVEQLIFKTVWDGLFYKMDLDARRYQPKDPSPQEYGTFDFVIVGGGAAGSVLANRLSENKDWKVLLIEAGQFANNVTDMPALAYPSMLSDYNWGFYSVPQKTACLGMVEKRCPYPRGRGVGGSSLINAVMQARGNAADYDKWAEMGNSGWSYKDLLPYFIKIENLHKNYNKAPVDWDYHGKHGRCSVSYSVINNTRNRIFYEAHQELGIPYADYNGQQQIGTSPIQFYLKNGRRHDAGTAYIKPILSRKNLVVLTESYATKIDIDSKRIAKGVYFTKNKKLYYVKASKEVILTAGTFQSAQLLMLSGVGPEAHLNKLGIKVLKNLSVGNNLKDHMSIFLLLTGDFNDITLTTLRQDVADYLVGKGLLTTARTLSSISFLKSKYMTDRPDVELIAVPQKFSKILDVFPIVFRYRIETALGSSSSILLKEAFPIEYIYLHPLSTGTVRLKSSNPYDYPLIDPKIFSNSADLERMYAGLEEIFKLIKTEPFQKYNTKIAPINLWFSCGSFRPESKKFWECYMKQTVYPFYHPTSTCSMGPDQEKGAVVDNKLNVYGIKNLRVADASVIPVTISGHTVAIAKVIGEKAADLIKEKYH